MPLTDPEYASAYDEPGSWGRLSEGWPSTPYTAGKFLLCTKAGVVPYGSYVVVGAKRVDPAPHTAPWMKAPSEHPYYDYSDALIRCETEELRDRLEEVHRQMFVICRGHFLSERTNGEFA